METPRPSPTSLQDLKPGTPLTGRITRIELSGAFVDVGLPVEGRVHVSRLSKKRVNRADEAVQVGQEVEVWVEAADEATQRLDLTMIRPLTFDWRDLRPGLRAVGKVVAVERYGAFVDIGAERSGLVHVSEMADDYVARPEDVVKIGDAVEVVVLDADRAKRQIRLSMKAARAPAVEEPEAVEPPAATAMEIALRRAMGELEAPAPSTPRPSAAGAPRRSRKVQDDILARTLQERARPTAK